VALRIAARPAASLRGGPRPWRRAHSRSWPTTTRSP
jgi:hypothetical protein